MNRKSDNSFFFLCVKITLFWCFLLLLILSVIHQKSLLGYLHEIIHTGFRPHVNIFHGALLEGKKLSFYLFTVFLLSLFNIILYLKRKPSDNRYVSLTSCAVILVTILLGINTLLSSLGQMKFFAEEQKGFANKTFEEKNRYMFGSIFDFAHFCRQAYPGPCRTQLITDMDITNDPGITHHRILAYYLYPLDIRNINKGPKDCLIFFNKNKGLRAVPENYVVLDFFSKDNFIAVKKLD